MSRRRRSGQGELITIFWRDIPAQVTAARGRDKEKAVLTDRFQHAIDRAAGVAGLTDTDSYVNEWRRESRPVDGDLLAAATGAVEQLEHAYPRDRLETLVRSGGLDPEAAPTNDTVASGDLTVGGQE